jgi:hypothetical protein
MLLDKLKQYGKYLGFVIFPNGSSATTTVTPVPNLTYTAKYFTPFNNASWDFGQMTPIGISVLGDFFAQPIGNQIIEGTIFVNIIGIIWVRQEDAGIPLFLLWAMSSIMFGMNIIPADWQWFLIAVQFITLGGIAYTLWRGRRNS